MIRVMIIYFTVKEVVGSKFIDDDKTGGKNTVEAYCSNTSEKSCVPYSSYNEDREEIRSLRDASEMEAQVLVVSHLLVMEQDDSRMIPTFLAWAAG